MYYAVENKFYQVKGVFSTHGQIVEYIGSSVNDDFDITGNRIYNSIIPGQFQAFLCSSEQFILWVEEWQMQLQNQNPFGDKTVYPAKATGLSIPLRNTSTAVANVTMRWREGLARWGNISNSPFNYDSQTGNLRPGYGQTIPTDLARPLKSVTVQTNNLGLVPRTPVQNTYHEVNTLGGLWSMAFYVDPEIAAKYRASNSKKKQKPLNSQDTETKPTYPPYTPTSGGGYSG
jgi:hypothetical protein